MGVVYKAEDLNTLVSLPRRFTLGLLHNKSLTRPRRGPSILRMESAYAVCVLGGDAGTPRSTDLKEKESRNLRGVRLSSFSSL